MTIETRVRSTSTSSGGGGSELEIAIGEPVIGGTAGSVLFVDSSGNLAQDNANFFWDDTGNILKLGGHLLVGGLTTDGTGVLQFPTATTSAGGITFGADINAFRSGSQTFTWNASVNGSNFYTFSNLTSGTAALTGIQLRQNNDNSRMLGMYYFSAGYTAAGLLLPAMGYISTPNNSTNGLLIATETTASIRLATNNTLALTLDSSQNATFAGAVSIGTSSNFKWEGTKARIYSPADGIIRLTNNADTPAFTRLQFGGTTNSFPALSPNGSQLEAVKADGSAYTNFAAASFQAAATGQFSFLNRAILLSTADGKLKLSNWGLTAGAILDFSTADTVKFRNYADDADAAITAAGATFSGTVNLRTGTASAGTSPIKFTAGTLLTVPEAGTIEYDGTDFYLAVA